MKSGKRKREDEADDISSSVKIVEVKRRKQVHVHWSKEHDILLKKLKGKVVNGRRSLSPFQDEMGSHVRTDMV
jgi:hypothetical protein